MDQRFYASTIGRFLTADQGPPDESTPASQNRYSYTWGDPVNYVDTDGRLPANVEPDGGGFGCVRNPFAGLDGSVGVSSGCPSGFTWFTGFSGGSKSQLQQIWEIFDGLRFIVQDWDYANSSGTLFAVTFRPEFFLQAGSIPAAEPTVWLITLRELARIVGLSPVAALAAILTSTTISTERVAECLRQQQADEETCRRLPNATKEDKAVRARCWESAKVRFKSLH